MTDIRIIARADRRARTRAAIMRYGTFGAIALYGIAGVSATRWMASQDGLPLATCAAIVAALGAVAALILWLIWRDHR